MLISQCRCNDGAAYVTIQYILLGVGGPLEDIVGISCVVLSPVAMLPENAGSMGVGSTSVPELEQERSKLLTSQLDRQIAICTVDIVVALFASIMNTNRYSADSHSAYTTEMP